MKPRIIVTENDLIGCLQGRSLPVVQAMVDYAVRHGSRDPIGSFQRNHKASSMLGGFNWIDSDEGTSFWYEVLDLDNEGLFYQRYPHLSPQGYSEKEFTGRYILINGAIRPF